MDTSIRRGTAAALIAWYVVDAAPPMGARARPLGRRPAQASADLWRAHIG